MSQAPIHPSDRVEMGVCDSDERCVTPGQRRKLNVYWAQAATGYWAPVLAVCKGCARRGAKATRAKRTQTVSKNTQQVCTQIHKSA